MERSRDWPAVGGVAHVMIEFSFAGPRAVLYEKPRERTSW